MLEVEGTTNQVEVHDEAILSHARAIIDACSSPEEMQEAERQRLFRIIEEFVKWENITNESVLHAARIEIARNVARNHGVSLPRNMATAEVAAALKQYAPPILAKSTLFLPLPRGNMRYISRSR